MAEALACNTGHILKVSMKPKKKLCTVDGSMVAYTFANRDKCREPKRQKKRIGHAGARTQDLGVISTALYRLSYATIS